jgi:hypothetical protein
MLAGGSDIGKGSGAGAAVVSGLVDYGFISTLRPTKTGGDAAFKSNGDGAGFVVSANGSALGSASAAVSGAVAGNTDGVGVDGVSRVDDFQSVATQRLTLKAHLPAASAHCRFLIRPVVQALVQAVSTLLEQGVDVQLLTPIAMRSRF